MDVGGVDRELAEACDERERRICANFLRLLVEQVSAQLRRRDSLLKRGEEGEEGEREDGERGGPERYGEEPRLDVAAVPRVDLR